MYLGNKIMQHNKLGSRQNIHSFGVSYLCNFLDRAGFSILEMNTAPDHHYQILAKIGDKSLLIAVRTACHPDAGTIDSAALETLVRESEELGLLPHFASLSVVPTATNDIEVDGLPEGQDYKVIFNGISAVRNDELVAVNI